MIEISSSTNALYKKWLSLLEGRGLRKEGLCLVSGKKLVEECLRNTPDAVEQILLPPKVEALNVRCKQARLSSALFKELDVIGTKAPIAVVRVPEIEPWAAHTPHGLELILALSDPGNLGSVLRSAEAFGVKRIILTEESASPFLPKSLRASAGASLRLKFFSAAKLESLKIQNALALDMAGENIRTAQWPRDSYLILGEEGRGLPKNLELRRLSIPMQPGTESLNATVAASIALYVYNQFQK